MSWRNETVAAAAMAVSLVSLVHAYDFGRPATMEEMKLWDIDVRPDGKGLPEGSGTVAHGKSVYEENCEACHGPNGQGGIKDRLAGGQGSLATENPIKTVGSYWPYATTLFDYIHRAMPYQAPGSLSVDDIRSCGLHPQLEWNPFFGWNARQEHPASDQNAQSRGLYPRPRIPRGRETQVGEEVP